MPLISQSIYFGSSDSGVIPIHWLSKLHLSACFLISKANTVIKLANQSTQEFHMYPPEHSANVSYY